MYTQAYLRASASQRQEAARLNDDTMSNERTFIAIKPDGVQRGLVGPIISRFESRGFKLVAIKLTIASKEHLEKHCTYYNGNGFKTIVDANPPQMLISPRSPSSQDSLSTWAAVPFALWSGRDVMLLRLAVVPLLGATNPLASAPGTIRGDYAIDVGRNVCHGSDSVESAQKEIALWFNQSEIQSWTSAQHDWIYEK
ncbi:hypothetical protein DH86_00000273 [Scytalidium sp. 3C]|nr:hypothetical protein DH86_00000273 [Scytalidium sp. 3C]